MASDGTGLGDRMKAYEAATGSILPRYLPAIIRVDGRAFHTLLRGADKPFDTVVARYMGYVAQALCAEIGGAVFAYQQSDEVSVLVCGYEDYRTQPWFGGRVQKIASISSAIATLAFLGYSREPGVILRRPGMFDARVFPLPNAVEVANYFAWRQRDTERNSKIMLARAHFPHGEIQGLGGVELEDKLEQEKGVYWIDEPKAFRYGRVCVRQELGSVDVRWLMQDAPSMTAAPDAWLARHIPPLPSFEEAPAVQEPRPSEFHGWHTGFAAKGEPEPIIQPPRLNFRALFSAKVTVNAPGG